MSSTYTTSSGNVRFTATTDSWAEPSGSDVDVIAFPGGDAVAVSISGQRETRRSFKALFATINDYKAMRAMRAKVGTLMVENWDAVPVNAILLRTAPDAMQVDGQVVAQVEFILY